MNGHQYGRMINNCHTLQLIGTPSETEVEFLNENAKRYLKQLPPYRRQSFTEKFPQVNAAAIDLIEKMLTFDPRQRITGEIILIFMPSAQLSQSFSEVIISIALQCNCSTSTKLLLGCQA